MDPMVFATKEKNDEFQKIFETVFPDPHIIGIRNENGGVQNVSLFSKTFSNPGIAIYSLVPHLTYQELCFYFLKPVKLGLIAVRITKCESRDIMGFMKFDFIEKDRRGESHNPINMCEDPETFEEMLFQPFDIITSPLTYINFALPRGAEIELMLFESRIGNIVI